MHTIYSMQTVVDFTLLLFSMILAIGFWQRLIAASSIIIFLYGMPSEPAISIEETIPPSDYIHSYTEITVPLNNMLRERELSHKKVSSFPSIVTPYNYR